MLEKGRGLSAAFKLLRRVRWLLLSILLIYTWLPLGTLQDSLWLAAGRIGLLLLILFALQALVLNMPQEEIVMGLYQVLLPLVLLGLPREKVVLRLMLTIENIAKMPEIVRQQQTATPTTQSRFSRISQRLMSVITGILSHCETASHGEVMINTAHGVPAWQWVVPIMVAMVYFALALAV